MWIEHLQSLPLRKCGLKLELKGEDYVSKESLPLRKCGLKQEDKTNVDRTLAVTSLAEVWIETTSYCFASR